MGEISFSGLRAEDVREVTSYDGAWPAQHLGPEETEEFAAILQEIAGREDPAPVLVSAGGPDSSDPMFLLRLWDDRFWQITAFTNGELSPYIKVNGRFYQIDFASCQALCLLYQRMALEIVLKRDEQGLGRRAVLPALQ